MKKVIISIIILLTVCSCSREVYVAPTPTLPNPQIWEHTEIQAQSEHSVTSQQEDIYLNPLHNTQAEIQMDLSYTEANPCTDSVVIKAFLRHVSNRYLAEMTKPGWYSNPNSILSGGVWVHIDDPQTTHIQEMVSLYVTKNYSGGNLAVLQILLSDGKDCGFSINETRSDVLCSSMNRLNNPAYTLKDGVELESYFSLGNYFLNYYLEIALFSEPAQWVDQRQTDDSLKAWFLIEQGEPILVVRRHLEGVGGLKCQDCTARSLSAESTFEFNWNTGELISEKNLVLYNDGSKSEWEAPPETLRQFHFQYYDELPKKIEELYLDATQKTQEAYRLKGIE